MSFASAVADLRHYAVPAQPRRRPLLDLLIRLETWLDNRESRRWLYRLDERALADVGLTQADVERPDPAASWQSLLLPQARR